MKSEIFRRFRIYKYEMVKKLNFQTKLSQPFWMFCDEVSERSAPPRLLSVAPCKLNSIRAKLACADSMNKILIYSESAEYI